MILVGIDGNYYLHKAWYTINPGPKWKTVDYKRALSHRLLSMVCADAADLGATHLCVAFDGGRVFRYDIYPQYKANRSGDGTNSERVRDSEGVPAKEVYNYLSDCIQILKHAGIPVFQFDRYEADDVLGSLAQLRTNVILGTRDKDMYQVLKPNVKLFYREGKALQFISHVDAERRLGVRIDQMVEYQALLGDSSDNIPQAKVRMGPKSVQKILNEHDSIKNFYRRASEKDKLWLIEAQAKIKTNKKLVTLVTDVFAPTPKDLRVKRVENNWLPQSYHVLTANSSSMFKTTEGNRGSIANLVKRKTRSRFEP